MTQSPDNYPDQNAQDPGQDQQNQRSTGFETSTSTGKGEKSYQDAVNTDTPAVQQPGQQPAPLGPNDPNYVPATPALD